LARSKIEIKPNNIQDLCCRALHISGDIVSMANMPPKMIRKRLNPAKAWEEGYNSNSELTYCKNLTPALTSS